MTKHNDIKLLETVRILSCRMWRIRNLLLLLLLSLFNFRFFSGSGNMSSEGNGSVLQRRRCLRILAARVNVADLYRVVQFASAQGRHADRDHRGGLSQRAEADAAAGDHLRRTAAQAGPRQDAHPQAVERQQGAAVYREQRRSSRLDRLRRFVPSLSLVTD